MRALILDGTLRPGDHVPQDDIAEELGISRIPVREALVALEREGWLSIEVHRGAFVGAIDEQFVRDHYDLFGTLYGFAARKAAANADADDLDAIAALERELAACGDAEAAATLAFDFHAAVVTASRSARLRLLLRAMSNLVPGNLFADVPGTLAIEQRGQAAIVRALRVGDGERAAAEYATTMRNIGDQVVGLLCSRGILSRET